MKPKYILVKGYSSIGLAIVQLVLLIVADLFLTSNFSSESTAILKEYTQESISNPYAFSDFYEKSTNLERFVSNGFVVVFFISSVLSIGLSIAFRLPFRSPFESLFVMVCVVWAIASLLIFILSIDGEIEVFPPTGKSPVYLLYLSLFPYGLLILRDSILGVLKDISEEHEKREQEQENTKIQDIKSLVEKGIISEVEEKEKLRALKEKAIRKELLESEDYQSLKRLLDSEVLSKSEFEEKFQKLVDKKVQESNSTDF